MHLSLVLRVSRCACPVVCAVSVRTLATIVHRSSGVLSGLHCGSRPRSGGRSVTLSRGGMCSREPAGILFAVSVAVSGAAFSVPLCLVMPARALEAGVRALAHIQGVLG